jgi:hypothetical protein
MLVRAGAVEAALQRLSSACKDCNHTSAAKYGDRLLHKSAALLQCLFQDQHAKTQAIHLGEEGVQRGSRGGPEGVQRGSRGGPEGV